MDEAKNAAQLAADAASGSSQLSELVPGSNLDALMIELDVVFKTQPRVDPYWRVWTNRMLMGWCVSS